MTQRIARVLSSFAVLWLAGLAQAQTQFSKRVLLVLPFIIFLVLNLINPSYMQPLYSTFAGRVLLALGGCGMLLGAWTMNRLAVLRY